MTVPANVMVKHGGKSDKDRLAEAEAILSDKINGMPVSQMMEKYGISKATVYRRIEDAVDARIAPTVDKYREQMNAAYDEQVVRANQNIAGCMSLIDMITRDPEAKPGDLAVAISAHARAIELLNRIREAQRKLNGLDMPVKADVTVTHVTPLDTEISDLVSQLDAPTAG